MLPKFFINVFKRCDFFFNFTNIILGLEYHIRVFGVIQYVHCKVEELEEVIKPIVGLSILSLRLSNDVFLFSAIVDARLLIDYIYHVLLELRFTLASVKFCNLILPILDCFKLIVHIGFKCADSVSDSLLFIEVLISHSISFCTNM